MGGRIEFDDQGNLLTRLLPDWQPADGEIAAEFYVSHWHHFDPTPGRWVGEDP